jgi:hypothetical protein
MSNEFKAIVTVTQADLEKALGSLQTAIDKKDTAGEWVNFTAKTLILLGKIAISQFGFGPALQLIEQVIGPNKDIMDILRKLLEEKNA